MAYQSPSGSSPSGSSSSGSSSSGSSSRNSTGNSAADAIRARSQNLGRVEVPEGGSYVGLVSRKSAGGGRELVNVDRTTDSKGRPLNTVTIIDPKTNKSRVVEATLENLARIEQERKKVIGTRDVQRISQRQTSHEEFVASLLRKQGKNAEITNRGVEWTDKGRRYFAGSGQYVAVPERQDTSRLKIDYGRVSRAEQQVRLNKAREIVRKQLEKEEKNRKNLTLLPADYQRKVDALNKYAEDLDTIAKKGVFVKGYNVENIEKAAKKVTEVFRQASSKFGKISNTKVSSFGKNTLKYLIGMPLYAVTTSPLVVGDVVVLTEGLLRKDTRAVINDYTKKNFVPYAKETLKDKDFWASVTAGTIMAIATGFISKKITGKPVEEITPAKVSSKLKSTANKVKDLAKKTKNVNARKSYKGGAAILDKLSKDKGFIRRTIEKVRQASKERQQVRGVKELVGKSYAREILEKQNKGRYLKNNLAKELRNAKEQGLNLNERKFLKSTWKSEIAKNNREIAALRRKLVKATSNFKAAKILKDLKKTQKGKFKVQASLSPRLKNALSKVSKKTRTAVSKVKTGTRKTLSKVNRDINNIFKTDSFVSDYKVINRRLVKPLTQVAKTKLIKIKNSIIKGKIKITKGITLINKVIGKFGLRIKLLKLKAKIKAYELAINPIKKTYKSIISSVRTGKNRVVFYLKKTATKGFVKALGRFNKISPVKLKVYFIDKMGRVYLMKGRIARRLKISKLSKKKSSIAARMKSRAKAIKRKRKTTRLSPAKRVKSRTGTLSAEAKRRIANRLKGYKLSANKEKIAKRFILAYKLNNIPFKKLPQYVKKIIRQKNIKKYSKDYSKRFLRVKKLKGQVLDSFAKSERIKFRFNKIRQKAKLRKAIKNIRLDNKVIVADLKLVNGVREMVIDVVKKSEIKPTARPQPRVILDETGKIIKGKKYAKQLQVREAVKVIRNVINEKTIKAKSGLLGSSSKFRKEFRKAIQKTGRYKEIGKSLRKEATRKPKTTTGTKRIEQKVNNLAKETQKQTRNVIERESGSGTVLLQKAEPVTPTQVKTTIKKINKVRNVKQKKAVVKRLQKSKNSLTRLRTKSRGKVRQILSARIAILGGLITIARRKPISRSGIGIGQVSRSSQAVTPISKQDIKQLQSPKVEQAIDSVVLQSLEQKPAVKQISAVASILSLGGAMGLLRSLPKVAKINNSNLGRSAKMYMRALKSYIRGKQYVYSPDLAALIYGEVATPSLRSKLLRVGRIFTGIERRLKV